MPDDATFPNLNTDRELWREREGDYYADSVFVTATGGIGINCGGSVVVMPIRAWFALASQPMQSGSLIYIVICVEPDGSEVRHMFSTQTKAEQWADTDPRDHVFYDYALDCPERHEGRSQ